MTYPSAARPTLRPDGHGAGVTVPKIWDRLRLRVTGRPSLAGPPAADSEAAAARGATASKFVLETGGNGKLASCFYSSSSVHITEWNIS